jgi:hypothetical protein
MVKLKLKLTNLKNKATGLVKAQEPKTNISANTNLAEVQLFHDKNGNGIRDPGEGDSPWAGVEVELTPTTDLVGFELNEGWNLINFPINPMSVKTAAEATRDVALDGGYITTIAYWDGDRWIEYSQRAEYQYGQDFELKPGIAYFVRASIPMTWAVAGERIQKPVSLDLKRGWNAIGIPYSNQPYSAAKLIDGLGADSVARWDSGLWDVFIKEYGFNFDIKKEEGIMVRVNKDLRFTPE